MRISLLLFFVIISNFYYTNAQVLETKNWCLSRCDIVGDELENSELLHLKMKNDSILYSAKTDSIKRIPLRIGIIQQESEEVEISELVVRRAVENLNNSFSDANFFFYIARTDVILSDLMLEDLSQNSYAPYNKFSDRYDEQGMISIYIFDHGKEFCESTEVSVSCGRTGGFSYILSNRTNNIVMSRFDIQDIKVFAHEMGHFWGLYHTFEEAQFGVDDFDNDKCHLVGDRICDTPPDPGTIFEVYVNYTTCELLNLQNDDGYDYKPMIENYMSYYKPCYLKEFKFTPGQIEVMQVAAALPMRSKFINSKVRTKR